MAKIKLEPLPPEEAIEAFRGKGFAVGFSWRDVWEAEHARAFTVAKAMELDLLADIRGAVDKALAEGQSFQQFKAELTPLLQKRGWWGRQIQVDPQTGEAQRVRLGSPRRLRTIYNTNMRVSYAAGQWQRIERRKAERPYLRYIQLDRPTKREEHSAWHDLVLPVDHPFWNTHYPPNDWECKCRVAQLSDRDLERLGLTVANDGDLERLGVDKKKRFKNDRTGQEIEVPEGIGPGWGYNVGKAAAARPVGGAFDVMANKLEAASPSVARASIAGFTRSRLFGRHLSGEFRGGFPVGRLPDEIAGALSAKSSVVRLSRETAIKQASTHKTLAQGDYGRLLEMIAAGQVLADRPRHLVLLQRFGGRWWHAAVKVTRDGRELYLQSFRRTDEENVAAVRKRSRVVREGEK